jgi:hypothetical protein
MAVVREWVRRDSGGVRVAGEAWVLGDAIAHFVFLGFVFWEREGRGEGLFMGFDYSWITGGMSFVLPTMFTCITIIGV